MITPDIFLGWLRDAISRIGPGYFGHVERVYCYELYHFLRVAMNDFESQGGSIENVYLHSEFVKVVISVENASHFDVIPLNHRRSPDFMLHEPNTTDHQIVAMEVKTDPRLSFSDFVDDINKLSELKNKYRYNLVIFHCVNVGLTRISDHLNRARVMGITIDNDVLIVAKPSSSLPVEESFIGDLQ